MSLVALSELLGAIVRDASGAVRGRVREVAIAPQDHPTRIAFLIVKTSAGFIDLTASTTTEVRANDWPIAWRISEGRKSSVAH